MKMMSRGRGGEERNAGVHLEIGGSDPEFPMQRSEKEKKKGFVAGSGMV